MTDNDESIRQTEGRLMEWIHEEQARRELNLTELANRLQISRPYLYALRAGTRQTDGMDRALIERIAGFLGKPVIAVYIAAGVISLDDFHSGTHDELEDEVRRAYEFVANDPEWGALCPPADTLEHNIRILLVHAYEQCSGRILLPHHGAISYMRSANPNS